MNDIEKVFSEDVRDKKRTANSARSKSGKSGYVGSVTTPADLLKGKERKEYEGTTPVITSSIYDYIMSFDEFKSLSRNQKMIYLQEYRKRFNAAEIAEKWGVTDKAVYYYYRAYGATENTKKSMLQKAAEVSPEPASLPEEYPHMQSNPLKQKEVTSPECNVIITGKFQGRRATRKLQSLSYMMEESQQYEIEIRIKELYESPIA